jgi:hypothetical protein
MGASGDAGLSPALVEALNVVADAVDACDPEKLPGLMELAAAIQARALVRLIALPRANGAGRPAVVAAPEEPLLDVTGAARIAHHSVSWMRKHGHALPGFCQPRGKGTAVGWVRQDLERWARGGGGCSSHT